MFNRNNKSSKIAASTLSVIENLEGRQMFSGTVLPTLPAHVLTLNAGAKSETIFVGQTGSSIVLDINGKSTTYSNVSSLVINGNSGNDTIVITKSVTVKASVFADSGNDTLVTGSSNDILTAGTGKSSLVALGGKYNTLVGGSGYTNIWSTAGNVYKKGSGTIDVHSIASFINTKDMSVDGATFAEPAVDTQLKDTAGFVNVAAMGYPLFSSHGPALNDISQGEAGTCYFLSSLGAVAMQSPQHMVNLITSVGDGTFIEQFVNTTTGKISFVRVDGYLPVSLTAYKQGTLQLEYEHLGVGGAMWAPLMEKGWAYFRAYEQGKAPSYGIAEGGTGQEGLISLGASSVLYTNDLTQNFVDGQEVLSWIDQQLQSGKAVDLGTNPNAKNIPNLLIDDHEYTAVEVVYNYDGSVAGIWVHNPWGVDTSNGMAPNGYNDGANDGYVFVTPDIAFACFSNLASGVV